MSIELQDITLESLDGTLAATNVQGHLTYPMLHLDRDPVPEDAQGRDQVLVFVDGKVRAAIQPTVIVLYEGNHFEQTLSIQTGGGWSISGVDTAKYQATRTEGTGDAVITITKAPAFTEPGNHACTFSITVDGAVQSVTNIQVYILIKDDSNIQPTVIVLHEGNNFEQTLSIQTGGGWSISGVDNSKYQVDRTAGTGDAVITITKAPAFTEPGHHACTFLITVDGAVQSVTSIQVYLFIKDDSKAAIEISYRQVLLDEENGYTQPLDIQIEGLEIVGVNDALITLNETTWQVMKVPALTTPGTYLCTFAVIDSSEVVIVNVTVHVSIPLEVYYYRSSTKISAVHGQTLTLDFTNSTSASLTIVRDRQWTITGMDADKITATYMSGTGNTSNSYQSYTTISKASSYLEPTGITEFLIESGSQWVKAAVDFGSSLTGIFVAPQGNEEGVSDTDNPVYLYL